MRRPTALLLAVALGGQPALAQDTWSRTVERRGDSGFAQPDPETWRAYAALVADLARAAPSGALPKDAAGRAAALRLVLTVEGDRAWLSERAGEAHGGGLLALRLGPLSSELVVQAPHPWYDKGTGALVGAIFDAGGVRAACLATARRAEEDGPLRGPRDAAHNPALLLQAATEGLAQGLRWPLFVQLHGFSDSTARADAVISTGRARATLLAPAREALRAALGQVIGREAAVRTGEEVPALAALGNVQAALLADRARFLHVELDPDARAALARPEARAILSAALRGLAAAPEGAP